MIKKIIKNIKTNASKKTESAGKIYLEKYLDKLEKLTSEFLAKYPQDTAFPEEVNNIYLTSKLLQLDIKINLVQFQK